MRDVMGEFGSIKEQLDGVGLLSEDTLVMLSGDGLKVVLDADGQLVTSDLFKRVQAPYAVFTSGRFAQERCCDKAPIKASSDDMAQLFGYKVPCVRRPGSRGGAFLIQDRGFVVTGRYVGEVVASAILLERMCQFEVLAPRIGTPQYLNPALCTAEHAVYLGKYSKHEREASDGRI